MEINIPGVLAEVTEAFRGYEDALSSNEPGRLNEYFWKSPMAVRYGVAENLYGHDEIAEYRLQRAQVGGAPDREVIREVITSYGEDFGTTCIDYVRSESGLAGRQSQAWARMPEGWRIVAAHVSLLREAD